MDSVICYYQLVLEANRALAEEFLKSETVIRKPLASISRSGLT